MKLIIKYFEMSSDHIFAIPDRIYKTEYIEVDMDDIDGYLSNKKDGYGNKFNKSESSIHGFDYTSRTSGIKIETYIPIEFTKI